MNWLISWYVTEEGISMRPFELQAGYLSSEQYCVSLACTQND